MIGLKYFKNKYTGAKSISQDIVLNLLATVLSTGVMQLILYPRLALFMDDDEYGGMLTAMGIVNVLALSLGNNMCNARLILNEKYKKKTLIGDFQILVIVSIIFTILTLISAELFFCWKKFLFFGITIVAILSVLRAYYLVAYRIDINYKQNLYVNIVMAIFYIIGAYVIITYASWPFVFALPCLACLVYIGITSDIIREPLKITCYFKDSFKVVTLLILSGIIGNITMYLDRFIVYPILGGSSVSYYTIAAFFSKSMSMVLLPMTSVLLTYIASDRIELTQKRYIYINWGLIGASVLFLIISITIGYYITALLYPTMIDSSKPYILLASIGIIIGIAGSFNSIVVLAKAPSYWQVVLSGLKLLIYLITCIILVRMSGLIGLCIGVIITNTSGFVANYMVGNYYLKRL